MLEHFELKNGLRVIASRIPSVGEVCVRATIFAGSRDDEIPGEHHFFEHFPFRGTEHLVNSWAITEPIERYAGDLGASTGTERTEFSCRVPSDLFHLAATTVRELSFCHRFDQAVFEDERKVIQQELLGYSNDPDRRMQFHLRGILFPGTKFQHQPIGMANTIAKIQLSDLKRIAEREYTVENSRVIVTGELPANFLALLDESFGRLSVARGSDRRRCDGKNWQIGGGRYVIEEPVFRHAILTMTNFIYPITAQEQVALEVFEEMVSGYASSPLFQEIREKRSLSYGFRFSIGMMGGGIGSCFFACDCGGDNLGETEDVFWKTIEVTQSNLHRFKFALDRAKWRRRLGARRPAKLADGIQSGLVNNSWIAQDEFELILAKLTLQGVARVALRLFDRSAVHTFIFTG